MSFDVVLIRCCRSMLFLGRCFLDLDVLVVEFGTTNAFHFFGDINWAQRSAAGLEEGVEDDLQDDTPELGHASHLDFVRSFEGRVNPDMSASNASFSVDQNKNNIGIYKIYIRRIKRLLFYCNKKYTLILNKIVKKC